MTGLSIGRSFVAPPGLAPAQEISMMLVEADRKRSANGPYPMSEVK